MAKFRDFLNNKLIQIPLHEAKKEFFMSKTDPGRIERAINDMRTNPPLVKDAGDGLERLEYNFKAKPSIEMKNHHGYVVYDPKTGDVKKLWCDCLDMHFRLWYPMVKAGYANWELPDKFEKRQTIPHTKTDTNQTNKNHELYVCKHLYALMNGYLN